MNITQKPSPNQDSNRVTIDRIIIHWIVGNLASADAVFAKPGNASVHYGIEDNEVHQYVQENKVAYHAGNYSMNQRSIGIEHSADQTRPASEQTYQTSGQLVREIAKRHNIPLDRQHILKHSEVVPTQCCGTVDVDKIIQIAKQGTPTPTPSDLRTSLADQLTNLYPDKLGVNNDSTKMTQEQIKLFKEWIASNVQRAGRYDIVVKFLFGDQADSSKATSQQSIDKIKALGQDNTVIKKKIIDYVTSL